ncbi:four helix bundle protein [Flavobacterium sp.]|uniref:four helix bundle protein n=1 Tax=Flavobacterium sp. TaxID=239 RepID=UPI003342B46C
MGSEVLKERTKQFALAILKLVECLSGQKSQNIIANQIVRSATSVGANYRAACRSRSDKEFVSKMNIVL